MNRAPDRRPRPHSGRTAATPGHPAVRSAKRGLSHHPGTTPYTGQVTTDAADSAGAPPAPTGVGSTALMVAAARVIETRRPNPLFTDPYAADFVTTSGIDVPIDENSGSADSSGSTDSLRQASASFSDYAPVRTRFFDDYLVEATRTARQVVIVAAGLDTRAFRLGLPPEVTVYELDSTEVLSFKQQVLDAGGARPTGRRIPVATDLRGAWPESLRDAGFDPAAPSAWLIEGLLAYLSPQDNDRLLASVSGLAVSGSRLAIEFLHVDAVELMVRALADSSGTDLQSMWRSGGVAEPSAPWLDRHGWDSDVYDTYERARAYHRELPPLGDTPMDRFADAARNSLVTAHRR